MVSKIGQGASLYFADLTEHRLLIKPTDQPWSQVITPQSPLTFPGRRNIERRQTNTALELVKHYMLPLFEMMAGQKHAKRLVEQPLVGTVKVGYCSTAEFDYEARTMEAPVDLTLAIPQHRPRRQPDHHRVSMFVSSETGAIRAKVARYCLHRSFNLEVVGATSDITVWVPSNFKGFITCTGMKASFSAGFTNHILPNTFVNTPVPKDWEGDEIIVHTTGMVTFRMWDVFTQAPEVPHKEVWKRMFRANDKCVVEPLNWDFLLDDDDS